MTDRERRVEIEKVLAEVAALSPSLTETKAQVLAVFQADALLRRFDVRTREEAEDERLQALADLEWSE